MLLRHVSNLEFDGDVPVYSIDHTPKGKGGASMVTAVVGRSGEKLELGQVSTDINRECSGKNSVGGAPTIMKYPFISSPPPPPLRHLPVLTNHFLILCSQ